MLQKPSKCQPYGPLGLHADFTSTSELLFVLASQALERMLVQNISHENDLIFKRMNVQVTCIFIQIVLHRLVLPVAKSTIHP